MPAKTSEPNDQPAEEPHYHGHRERLRDRFHGAGPDALSDYELLEMVRSAPVARRRQTAGQTLIEKIGCSWKPFMRWSLRQS
jgi:DNA repair protein RadC